MIRQAPQLLDTTNPFHEHTQGQAPGLCGGQGTEDTVAVTHMPQQAALPAAAIAVACTTAQDRGAGAEAAALPVPCQHTPLLTFMGFIKSYKSLHQRPLLLLAVVTQWCDASFSACASALPPTALGVLCPSHPPASLACVCCCCVRASASAQLHEQPKHSWRLPVLPGTRLASLQHGPRAEGVGWEAVQWIRGAFVPITEGLSLQAGGVKCWLALISYRWQAGRRACAGMGFVVKKAKLLLQNPPPGLHFLPVTRTPFPHQIEERGRRFRLHTHSDLLHGCSGYTTTQQSLAHHRQTVPSFVAVQGRCRQSSSPQGPSTRGS